LRKSNKDKIHCDDPEFLTAVLESKLGGNESNSILQCVTNTETGESVLEMRHTIIETAPVTDVKRLRKIWYELNERSGRRIVRLGELANVKE